MQLRCFLPRAVLLALGLAFLSQAHAGTVSHSGNFTNDDDRYVDPFSTSTTQDYSFSTSSFAAGGFVPVITIFDATGHNLGSEGGDGPCVSAATCMDDAHLSLILGPGSYSLYLTEFPNTPDPSGLLSAGFLFDGDHTATGDVCGVSGGKFLQTDTTPCGERGDFYTVSLTNSPVPEPATWLLVLPPAAFLMLRSRRRLS